MLRAGQNPLILQSVSRSPFTQSKLYASNIRSSKRWKNFMDTRLPPKIKRRVPPNPNKVGVFHSGRRLSTAESTYYYRFPDVTNNSAYDPPFLMNDYMYDTSDFILEPMRGGKGIVMNREHTLNAFDSHIISTLEPLVKKYSHQPLTSFVTFLKGKGSVFSTGTDFVEIYTKLQKPEGEAEVLEFFRKLYTMVHHVHNADTAVMPVIGGLTLGSAASFSVNCVATAATPDGDIAWPETGFGFHPDAGASYILSSLPSGIGSWLALTGSRLTGHSIVKAGLATHFYDEDLIQVIQDNMDQYPFKSKEQAWRMLDWGNNCNHEPFSLLPYLSTMENCFHEKSSVQEIMQSLADTATPWALAQLEKLKKKSPLSLVITHQALKTVQEKNLSIDSVLLQDFRLTRRFLNHSDFLSGVKNLIVNKQGVPEWRYSSVKEVPQQVVEEFFSAYEDEDDEFIVRGKNAKVKLEDNLTQLEGIYRTAVTGKPAVKNPLSVMNSVNFSEPVFNYFDEGVPVPSANDLISGPEQGYESFDSDTDAEFEYGVEGENPTYSVFTHNSGRDATQILADIETISAEMLWSVERTVEPTGKWACPSFADNMVALQEGLEISLPEQPIADAVTQGRVFHEAQVNQVEEDDLESLRREFLANNPQPVEKSVTRDFGYSDDDLVFQTGQKLLPNLPAADETVSDDSDNPGLLWDSQPEEQEVARWSDLDSE